MTKRTIETYNQSKAAKDALLKPMHYVGCTCSNPACKTTWIVCELPQVMKRLTLFTGQHKQCPCCGHPDPKLATTAEIRTLLAEEN